MDQGDDVCSFEDAPAHHAPEMVHEPSLHAPAIATSTFGWSQSYTL